MFETCHIPLVSMKRNIGMDAAILLQSIACQIHSRTRLNVKVEMAAHDACWFTTILERILRSDVTTAAQVSSAEDSSARIVKSRD